MILDQLISKYINTLLLTILLEIRKSQSRLSSKNALEEKISKKEKIYKKIYKKEKIQKTFKR